MDDNMNETGQNEVELVSVKSSPMENIGLFKKVKKHWMISIKGAIIVGIIIVIVVLGYVYKGLFVAAMVNGRPISRLSIVSKLEKTSGKKVLEALITQKLIADELDKKKITVTNDEISAELKKIEDQIKSQGGTLEQALAGQGMTMADLKDQVSINLRIEKLFADKTQVNDAEVAKYIKDNKVTIPKGQEAQYSQQIADQLKSTKLNQVAGDWVSSLRAGASIKYFVNY